LRTAGLADGRKVELVDDRLGERAGAGLLLQAASSGGATCGERQQACREAEGVVPGHGVAVVEAGSCGVAGG
jgi:hypothetical protein